MNKLTVAVIFSVCVVVAMGSIGATTRPAPATTRAVAKTKALAPMRPLIVAHRGASGTIPEHTMAAYRLAIKLGADAIEPDLVSTKDGVLIARHENELSDTTDVAKKFPKRERTKMIDGRKKRGWFSEDFTLAEIKTLRAKERLPFRSQALNGKLSIPTFKEILELVKQHNKGRVRKLMIVPELKHPTHFQRIGLALEPKLLALLKQYKMDDDKAPVVVQSFEVSNLKWLHKRSKVRLLQLLGAPVMRPYDWAVKKSKGSYATMMTDAGLKAIAQYAYAIGPWKGLLWMPLKYRLVMKASPQLVSRAHRCGLRVFAYTFRNEARYLDSRYKGSPTLEYHTFFKMGVDAFFTDFPATGVKAWATYLLQSTP